MKFDPGGAKRLAPGLLAASVAVALAASFPALAADGPGLRLDPERRIFPQWPSHVALTPAATASTLVVSNCSDAGIGSLRDTIAAAANGDTIDLGQLQCSRITLTSGAIPLPVPNLVLAGPGRDALHIDANGASRILFHPFGGTLTVSGLTIEDGADITTGFNIAGGGCLASAGYLVLENSTIQNCLASGEGAYGGGVYAYSLTMQDSTLAGNTALGANELANTAGWGGGAFVYQLDMDRSILSGNRATNDPNDGHTSTDFGGGALVVRGATVTGSAIVDNYSYGRGGGLASLSGLGISNSTISGNRAAHGAGGGLFVRRPAALALDNSTVTANYAQAGGGIAVYAATSHIASSIVAGNSAAAGAADLTSTDAVSINGGRNLIGAASPGITLPADTSSASPALEPLAYNGGPTPTHALAYGSPAVDAGSNPLGLASDQRGSGYPRSHGPAPDIGAFERQVAVAPDEPTSVPAVSTWSLALLAALLACSGWRRQRPTPRRD